VGKKRHGVLFTRDTQERKEKKEKSPGSFSLGKVREIYPALNFEKGGEKGPTRGTSMGKKKGKTLSLSSQGQMGKKRKKGKNHRTYPEKKRNVEACFPPSSLLSKWCGEAKKKKKKKHRGNVGGGGPRSHRLFSLTGS